MGHNLERGRQKILSILGSISGQKGGSKNDPKLRHPFGPPLSSSWALLASIVAPMGSQNGSKMGPKNDPPEILKTVLSPRRELT